MKKIITIPLFILLTLSLFSQNKTGFRFASVFGLTAANISSFLLDKDRAILMGVGLDSTNTVGALIVAIDTASGKILKSNCVHLDSTTNFFDVPNTIQKTADGGYIALYMPYKQNGSILVKFNKNLEKEFVKFYLDDNKDLCYYATMTALKDGYFLAGHRYYNNTVQKHFLQKIDLNGNRLWEKMYPGLKKDSVQYITSFVKLSDNSFAIALFNAYTEISKPNLATYQSKVFLVDSLGNLKKTLYSAKDSSYKVVGLQKVEGGYIYGTYRLKTKTLYNGSGSVLYIIRTDENFQPIWQKKFRFWSAPHVNNISDVIATADGNFVAVGITTNSYNYPTKTEAPQIEKSPCGYIHKFNINGDSIWARRDTMFYNDQLTVGGHSGFYSAVALPSGGIIAVGFSRYGFGTGASNEKDYGWVQKISKDGCVEEITCQNTVSTSEIFSIPIQVYPNPTNGLQNFAWDKSSYNFSVLKIYDLSGKIQVIKNLEDRINSTTIDFSLSPEGLYFYELKGEHDTKSGKFILQKD